MIRVLDLHITPEGAEGDPKARIELVTRDVTEAEKIAKRWEKKKELSLKVVAKKRSLDANAYCWSLCHRIAEVLHTTREEIYREAVRSVGVFTDLAVRRSDLSSFVEHWTEQGIGYQVDIYDSGLADNQGTPMKRVRAYIGSHHYDSKEMSVLLDHLIEQAKDLDIQTETEDEIKRMKAAWGEENV